MSAPELTAAQRKVLGELGFRACEEDGAAWLADRAVGQYALVVRTIGGQHLLKLTVAPSTLSLLHEHGLIEYGQDRAAFAYLEPGVGVVESPRAMEVKITKAGLAAFNDPKARHRANVRVDSK